MTTITTDPDAMVAVSDGRQPITFATYNNDCRGIINEGMKGPSTFGQGMFPVTAEYDPETNKTRVGFSYFAPPATKEA